MAQLFRDPGIAHGEEMHYRASAGGAATTTDIQTRIEHDGDGRYLHFANVDQDGLRIAIEQSFTRDDGFLRAEHYRMETRSDGKVVSREEGYFQETRHVQFGGDVGPFPRDVLPLVGGMVGLRGLEFRRGAKRTVNLWLAFSVHWPIEVKVERSERVRIPAGEFEAWRVKVRPSFAQISGILDRLVGGLLPDFTLHFDTADGHRMLRFEFPTGPMPWNPKGLLEATKVG